jgi:TIR domain
MSTVFISYRRETAAGEARALFNELVARLGKSSVFMDVDSIALGRDFRSALQRTLGSCDLMLVMIDKDWATVKDEHGATRLESPGDFVRLEVETALKRDIIVAPVLVKGAQMPSPELLPAEIRDLAYRNGFELSYNRWESDVAEMIKRLGLDDPGGGLGDGKAAKSTEAPATTPKPMRAEWRGWALASALVLALIAVWLSRSRFGADLFGASPAFRVTEAVLNAEPATYTGDCPVRITFRGRISAVGGSGNVSYRFLRNGAASAPIQVLLFNQAASKDVSTSWTVGRPGMKVSGWQAIEIIDPAPLKSDPAPFSIDCSPAPGGEAAKMPNPDSSSASAPGDFSGLWIEKDPKDPSRPFRLTITQTGSQVFAAGSAFGIVGEEASASGEQGCAPQFQHAGYSYGAPPSNKAGTFSLRLKRQGAGLLYIAESFWTSPCDGHEIGPDKAFQVELVRDAAK